MQPQLADQNRIPEHTITIRIFRDVVYHEIKGKWYYWQRISSNKNYDYCDARKGCGRRNCWQSKVSGYSRPGVGIPGLAGSDHPGHQSALRSSVKFEVVKMSKGEYR